MGQIEAPEATTPVKTASVIVPRVPYPPSEIVSDVLANDPVLDVTCDDLPSHAAPIVFGEDKPIAASGTYNVDPLATEVTGYTLSCSFSLQG